MVKYGIRLIVYAESDYPFYVSEIEKGGGTCVADQLQENALTFYSRQKALEALTDVKTHCESESLKWDQLDIFPIKQYFSSSRIKI